MECCGLRSNDILNLESGVFQIRIPAEFEPLEHIQQSTPIVPGHASGRVHYIISRQGTDGNEPDVLHAETGSHAEVLLPDLCIPGFRKIDQVHLVDGNDHVSDAQHGGDDRMPACLLEHTLTCIDQNDDGISMTGSGDHVPGVLDMPRCIRDDELADGRRKITVGHVNGDALLALCPKSIGEQCQIDLSVRTPL